MQPPLLFEMEILVVYVFFIVCSLTVSLVDFTLTHFA